MPDGFGSEPARDAENLAFELWYATHAFDYERHPIGSRECALQRAAWIARSTRGTAPPADERVARLEGLLREIMDRQFPESLLERIRAALGG